MNPISSETKYCHVLMGRTETCFALSEVMAVTRLLLGMDVWFEERGLLVKLGFVSTLG